MSAHRITAIVPLYNGQDSIVAAVESLANQDYSNLTILVIDDKSRDDSIRTVEEHFSGISRIELMRNEENVGLAATLNKGIANADGEFVFVLQQDCALTVKDWLSKAMTHFSDTRVAAVTGRPRPPNQYANFSQKAFAVLRGRFHAYHRADLEEIAFSEGKCDLYKKHTLLRAGAFSSNIFRTTGEDQMVSYTLRRMGFRLVRDNNLVFIQGFSNTESSMGSNLMKEYNYGKAQAGLLRRHGSFVLSTPSESESHPRRVFHRTTKPIFTTLLAAIVVFGLVFPNPSLWGILPILVLGRLAFYMRYCSRSSIRLSLSETLLTSVCGFLTDITYSAGLAAGFILSLLGRQL